MKKLHVVMMLATLVLLTAFPSALQAGGRDEGPVSPTTSNGKKWRIGYMEGGPYRDYQAVFKAILDGLTELGWIEKGQYPDSMDESETRTLWTWLSTAAQSATLEFVPDAYWSAGWNEEVRKENRKAFLSRANEKKDLDLMLAFGTKAGLDLANDLHSVPTLVLSCTDALQAGILKSAEDSGYDHVHGKVEPGRYTRQIQLFHDIAKFKRLGIAYEDSTDGRSYAALHEIRKAASNLGFQVLECHTITSTGTSQDADESVVGCYTKLAPQVDAVYLTNQRGVNRKNLPRILDPLLKHNVLTFSQGRTDDVKYGVLMSLAQEDFIEIGRFHARALARVLNGAKPRELSQIFESNQEIAVNLETAKKVGFRIPIEVLAGAREIYDRIEPINENQGK